MKRKTKDKIKTLTKAFFDIMAIGTLVTLAGLLSQGRTADKLFKALKGYSIWRIKQMLRQQKFYGMIEYDEEDENSLIVLTKKGFTRITKEKFKKIKGRKWDHLWRLISFDVPERKKSRRKFQWQLRSLGFYKIQKSIYAYPYECEQDIKVIASQYNITTNVRVFIVPNLGADEQAARMHYFQEYDPKEIYQQKFADRQFLVGVR
ncbi:MAG: CRISPR-associated endonuclease Cas2 [Patescibacteria group bacterium]|nr:CRISPR-associated endonuclease Cas2 [Patescibacteria group bacterium]MBU2509309.1 CRISPR-associated endonuclease Cas2 [Patescibacteria group bacterium]